MKTTILAALVATAVLGAAPAASAQPYWHHHWRHWHHGWGWRHHHWRRWHHWRHW